MLIQNYNNFTAMLYKNFSNVNTHIAASLIIKRYIHLRKHVKHYTQLHNTKKQH